MILLYSTSKSPPTPAFPASLYCHYQIEQKRLKKNLKTLQNHDVSAKLFYFVFSQNLFQSKTHNIQAVRLDLIAAIFNHKETFTQWRQFLPMCLNVVGFFWAYLQYTINKRWSTFQALTKQNKQIQTCINIGSSKDMKKIQNKTSILLYKHAHITIINSCFRDQS